MEHDIREFGEETDAVTPVERCLRSSACAWQFVVKADRVCFCIYAYVCAIEITLIISKFIDDYGKYKKKRKSNRNSGRRKS